MHKTSNLLSVEFVKCRTEDVGRWYGRCYVGGDEHQSYVGRCYVGGCSAWFCCILMVKTYQLITSLNKDNMWLKRN